MDVNLAILFPILESFKKRSSISSLWQLESLPYMHFGEVGILGGEKTQRGLNAKAFKNAASQLLTLWQSEQETDSWIYWHVNRESPIQRS
jgi:hypothetical protein